MLRITAELLPGGEEASKSTLAIMEIANLSSLADLSDYSVRVVTAQPNGDVAMCQRQIVGFPRRWHNVWGIVLAAIGAMGPESCSADPDAPLRRPTRREHRQMIKMLEARS